MKENELYTICTISRGKMSRINGEWETLHIKFDDLDIMCRVSVSIRKYKIVCIGFAKHMVFLYNLAAFFSEGLFVQFGRLLYYELIVKDVLNTQKINSV